MCREEGSSGSIELSLKYQKADTEEGFLTSLKKQVLLCYRLDLLQSISVKNP